MLFRIGNNLGDVIEEGDHIYGDGVNIAAGLAVGGEVNISGTTYDAKGINVCSIISMCYKKESGFYFINIE